MENFDVGYTQEKIKPDAIDDMTKILRGELSAIEAYRQVLSKLANHHNARMLEIFLEQHTRAVDYWKNQMAIEGHLESIDSGIWGKTVMAFAGIAKMMGSHYAVLALKEGEEYGLSLYKEMAKNEELTDSQRQYIREYLIPQQKTHINRLNILAQTLD